MEASTSKDLSLGAVHINSTSASTLMTENFHGWLKISEKSKTVFSGVLV